MSTSFPGNRSYITRLFLPMALIQAALVILSSALIVHILYGNAEEYIITNRRQSLIRVSEYVQNQLGTARTIAGFLINDTDIMMAKVQPSQTILQKQVIPAKLARYILSSSIIREIFLYIENTGYIFSSDSMYVARESVTTLRADDVYLHEFMKDPANNFRIRQTMITGPNMQAKEYLLYTASYAAGISICVSFDCSLLSNPNVAIDINGSNELLLLVSERGQVLASNFHYQGKLIDEKRLARGGKTSFNGSAYHLIHENVKGEGLSLIMWIPAVNIRERLSTILSLGISLAAVGFVLVLGLSYFIAKFNYKPIGRLYESAVGKKASKVNELQGIDNTIQRFRDENLRIRNFFFDSQQAIRNGIMGSIVNGRYSNIEELNREASLLGRIFRSGAYWIMVLVSEKRLSEGISLLNEFRLTGPDHHSLFGAQLYNEKEYVCFIIAEQGNFDATSAKELYDFAVQRVDPSIMIGVSNKQMELCNMGLSLNEARSAAEYQSDPRLKLSFFGDLPLMRESIDSILELELSISKVKAPLLKGDKRKLSEALHEISTYAETHSLAAPVIRSVRNRLSSLGIFAFGTYIDHFKKGSSDFDLSRLDAGNPIPDLIIALDDLGEEIQKIIFMLEIVNNAANVEEIKNFINARCFAYDFSVLGVSEHFRISSSSLGKIFYQITGKTLIAYVTELRLEKAKRLLENTDSLISEIVHHVGYLSETTFSNTFKKYTGISPNAYRKLHSTLDRVREGGR